MGFIEDIYRKMFGHRFIPGARKVTFPDQSNICPTPGMKIRSKGMGRGLARGKGRGPIGAPYKYK